MAIYAVHSPSLERDPVAAFDRARTLKLGFAWAAFFFGPLWLLARGLWAALAVWLLVAAAAGLAVGFGLLNPFAAAALYGLSVWFLGLEGRSLQAGALARRGRPLADIVMGAAPMDAERGFLARALHARPPTSAAPIRAGASARGGSGIIGLFPEAETGG
jgi:hypothetical protein